jgi:hypothetical protein
MNTVISALQGANRRAEGAANSVSNVSCLSPCRDVHTVRLELKHFPFDKNCGKIGAWGEAVRSNRRIRAQEGRAYRTFCQPRANYNRSS